MRVNEGIYHMWVAAYVRNCACMWVTLRTCVIHTVGVIHTVYVGDCLYVSDCAYVHVYG